jgi:hypothetical protein
MSATDSTGSTGETAVPHENKLRHLTSPPGYEPLNNDGIMDCVEWWSNNIVSFEGSCHTFAAQSVSSVITRNIKETVIAWSAQQTLRQSKRRKKKRAKLTTLQV